MFLLLVPRFGVYLIAGSSLTGSDRLTHCDVRGESGRQLKFPQENSALAEPSSAKKQSPLRFVGDPSSFLISRDFSVQLLRARLSTRTVAGQGQPCLVPSPQFRASPTRSCTRWAPASTQRYLAMPIFKFHFTPSHACALSCARDFSLACQKVARGSAS